MARANQGRCFASVLVGIAFSSAAAYAQDDGELTASERRAREEYALGSQAFEAENYEEAAAHYQAAYDAQRLPLLLFNIGSAFDRAGQKRDAVTHYRAYLAAVPEAENRRYVESRLTILQDQLDREPGRDASSDESAPEPMDDEVEYEEPRVPAADPPTPQERADSEGRSIAGPVTLIALGGAAGVVALATGLHTLALKSEIDEQCADMVCQEAVRSDVESMGTFALVTDIMVAVAGAGLLAGVLWLALGSGSDDSDEVAFSCGPLSCQLRGRF